MKNVIKKAEEMLKNANDEHELGADNAYSIAYWAAYKDGAIAQKKEDIANDSVAKTAELTGAFLVSVSEYAKQMNALFDEINLVRCQINKDEDE